MIHSSLGNRLATWQDCFDICRLENNGYKDLSQFVPFTDSLDGIHAGGVNSFCKDYFEKAAQPFIKIWRKGYDKHMKKWWLTDDKMHYVLEVTQQSRGAWQDGFCIMTIMPAWRLMATQWWVDTISTMNWRSLLLPNLGSKYTKYATMNTSSWKPKMTELRMRRASWTFALNQTRSGYL